MDSKRIRILLRAIRRIAIAGMSAIVLFGLYSPAAQAAAVNVIEGQRAQAFAAAAQEFSVPANVLLAVSYNESRWTPHGVSPSIDNGYGLLDLRAPVTGQGQDDRGDPGRPLSVIAPRTPRAGSYTLDDAATLLRLPAKTLIENEQQNIRGGAAVLADYARQTNSGQLPAATNDWYAAVAKYSGAASAQVAQSFADNVFATMQSGVELHTQDGQMLRITAEPGLAPNRSMLAEVGLAQPLSLRSGDSGSGTGAVDCPRTLNCRFIPAAYGPSTPVGDPSLYGNYDPANRPYDMDIKYIIIHDTEGSYESAIDWFQTSLFYDPPTYVSANYVIRSSDGAITEMVHPGDVAWQAGNWSVNMHSIGIEHEGFAAQGAAWYTEAMYKSSAKLVRYLAKKYSIPLDRQHILGHNNIPRLSPDSAATAHTDPGPYWDWDHYMDLLHAPEPSPGPVTRHTKVLTIAPNFATNQQPVQDCSSGTCVDLPAQGTNVVYLHAQPSNSSPLLSNPYMHPDNAPGTTSITDWSATATAGDQFAVADVQGDWTGIWYGGKIGWFYNPRGANKTAYASHSKVITPKSGQASIPVYGGAYPEAAAFPATIPNPNLQVLYQIPAGQSYVTSDKVRSDYFYDATYNSSLPDDHMIVRGNDRYYKISLNHRIGFVKVSDVTTQTH